VLASTGAVYICPSALLPVYTRTNVATTCGMHWQAAVDAVDVAAGLSLGEYTALAFAGAFRCAPLNALSAV
jgi:malonyl CoA-acyl carrier protein transacylase